MKLRIRLLTYGAIFPIVFLLVGVVAAGVVFERSLLAEHDRALMSQAAVEAVSLFDRAAAPHLHLSDSPLGSSVQDIAPQGALYGPDGKRVTEYPQGADVPVSLLPASESQKYDLRTESRSGAAVRVLTVRVNDPSGRPFSLWLGASLTRHDREIETYWRISGAFVIAAACFAFGLQWFHARGLATRIDNLRAHMRALQAGELAARPPPDEVADELGELRDAIADTSARLEAAQKTQDRLVADAAHELRSPLASMRVAIDVTLRRERSHDALRDCLERVGAEVDRLSALATRLLDLAALRAAPVAREEADLVPILFQAVDSARTTAEPRSVVVGFTAPKTATGLFAVSAVRQAVDNLLSNALEFSPKGGRVDVELGVIDGNWCIRVMDEGPGVPPEEREAVFEPFHRASHGSRGKGLGLAIVRDVAALHDGWVGIDDSTRAGSCFQLFLGKARPAA